jgi:monoamine oxidase
MAARELAKAGKKVIILEARLRLGGRIVPIGIDDLGYPLEGAAEFVHGKGAVTKALLKEAELHTVPIEGEYWNVRRGTPEKNRFVEVEEQAFVEKLKTVTQDLPIQQFLDKEFPAEQYADLRNAVTHMVEGYDAAEMNRMSTIAVHDEWANEEDMEQSRVAEGYAAMISFLESECKKAGVQIIINAEVSSVDSSKQKITVQTKEGIVYRAEKVIVTVPLPLIQTIAFNPAIPEKIAAIEEMGFGPAMKIFLKFKSEWWKGLNNGDFANMQMIISNEVMGTWWTQYPHEIAIITGWFAGPDSLRYADKTDNEITDTAIECLAKIFKVEKEMLHRELVATKVMNWPADPFTRGAYSYTTVGAREAIKTLSEPIDNKLFFAGEAVYSGKDTGTVEGALASGREVADKIKNPAR